MTTWLKKFETIPLPPKSMLHNVLFHAKTRRRLMRKDKTCQVTNNSIINIESGEVGFEKALLFFGVKNS